MGSDKSVGIHGGEKTSLVTEKEVQDEKLRVFIGDGMRSEREGGGLKNDIHASVQEGR